MGYPGPESWQPCEVLRSFHDAREKDAKYLERVTRHNLYLSLSLTLSLSFSFSFSVPLQIGIQIYTYIQNTYLDVQCEVFTCLHVHLFIHMCACVHACVHAWMDIPE